MRDWYLGTGNHWTSMGVYSNGEYGITKGLFYSFPVTCKDGKWKIVEGLEISEEQRKRMKLTEDELVKEREFVQNMLH